MDSQINKKRVSTRNEAPALLFIENRPQSVDINSFIHRACVCIKDSTKDYCIKTSQIYTGSHGHRYFYIYLFIPKEDIQKVLDTIVDTFQDSMNNKTIVISYKHNAQIKELKTPQKTINNPNEEKGKSIRINITMDDIEEFWDYLESREPKRQNRERYKKAITNLFVNGWNDYRHSTFIDNKKYKVNPKDIEIFVNGIKTNAFNIKMKEYRESLELYLSYKWAKKYEKPHITNMKDSPIPPVIKKREQKEKLKEQEGNTDGKKIFATISHLESWESQKTENTEKESSHETICYNGGEKGSRKSKTLKASSISEDDNSVRISINMDKEEKVVSDDKEGPKVMGADINDEKPSSLFQILRVVFSNFGEFCRAIYSAFHKKST